MRRIVSFIGAIRAWEAAPFCGVALLGYLLDRRTAGCSLPASLWFAVSGSFFLAGFAFVFNDLQDVEADRLSGIKSERPLVSGLFSPVTSRALSAMFAVTGVFLLALGTKWQSLVIGLATVPLSILYCIRIFPLKTVPVISSLLHVVQATLVFLLGAWSTGQADPASLWIGLYFGILLAAGHLHHEVLDQEADRRTGVRTHAVRFGAGPTLRAGFLVWCLSCVYFSALMLLDLVPTSLGWIQLAMFACYLAAFFALVPGGTNARRMRGLQKIYRVAYFLGGLAMIAALASERSCFR
ncbi:MAG TPA: UbiA family prenyltransferase [Myxococcota bacterium]|nr:UbiA family prenyltransferase [Myxococcota bacterium]